MKLLKTLWPAPFAIREREVQSFVCIIILFAVLAAVVSSVLGIIGGAVPTVAVRVLLSVAVALTDIYSAAAILLSILKFVGVIKD